jgi:hypothetical protein
VPIHLTDPTRGQKNHLCEERADLSGEGIEHIRATAPSAVTTQHEADREMVLKEPDVRALRAPLHQRPLDLHTGPIQCVHNPPLGMTALTPQIKGSVVTAREVHAQPAQFLHESRSFPDHDIDDLGSDQSRPRLQGIRHVQVEAVLGGAYRGDTSLGVVGVRLGVLLLRDDVDTSVVLYLQGKGQACHATAQYQEITGRSHCLSSCVECDRAEPASALPRSSSASAQPRPAAPAAHGRATAQHPSRS